jgi:hypothetical protein
MTVVERSISRSGQKLDRPGRKPAIRFRKSDQEMKMLPYTAYDIIRTVYTEVDLSRTPVREHYHAFGADSGAGAGSSTDGRGGGGGFPVSRGLFASARALFGRRSRPAHVAQPLT